MLYHLKRTNNHVDSKVPLLTFVLSDEGVVSEKKKFSSVLQMGKIGAIGKKAHSSGNKFITNSSLKD